MLFQPSLWRLLLTSVPNMLKYLGQVEDSIINIYHKTCWLLLANLSSWNHEIVLKYIYIILQKLF